MNSFCPLTSTDDICTAELCVDHPGDSRFKFLRREGQCLAKCPGIHDKGVQT